MVINCTKTYIFIICKSIYKCDLHLFNCNQTHL